MSAVGRRSVSGAPVRALPDEASGRARARYSSSPREVREVPCAPSSDSSWRKRAAGTVPAWMRPSRANAISLSVRSLKRPARRSSKAKPTLRAPRISALGRPMRMGTVTTSTIPLAPGQKAVVSRPASASGMPGSLAGSPSAASTLPTRARTRPVRSTTMSSADPTWSWASRASGSTVGGSARSTTALSLGRSATRRAMRRALSTRISWCWSTSRPASSRPRCSSRSASRVTRTLTMEMATPIETTASAALATKMRFVRVEKGFMRARSPPRGRRLPRARVRCGSWRPGPGATRPRYTCRAEARRCGTHRARWSPRSAGGRTPV